MVVSPLQPQKQRTRDQSQPAEIDDCTQIGFRARDTRNLHLFEVFERLRAHIKTVRSGTLQVADRSAEDFHFVHLLVVAVGGVVRNFDCVSQRDQGCI